MMKAGMLMKAAGLPPSMITAMRRQAKATPIPIAVLAFIPFPVRWSRDGRPWPRGEHPVNRPEPPLLHASPSGLRLLRMTEGEVHDLGERRRGLALLERIGDDARPPLDDQVADLFRRLADDELGGVRERHHRVRMSLDGLDEVRVEVEGLGRLVEAMKFDHGCV